MIRGLSHILSRMAMFLVAFVILVACAEKGGPDIPVRHMLLQVCLEENITVKGQPSEQETTFNTIRIYAYQIGRAHV